MAGMPYLGVSSRCIPAGNITHNTHLKTIGILWEEPLGQPQTDSADNMVGG